MSDQVGRHHIGPAQMVKVKLRFLAPSAEIAETAKR